MLPTLRVVSSRLLVEHFHFLSLCLTIILCLFPTEVITNSFALPWYKKEY